LKWINVDKYHLKSVGGLAQYYISKSMICEKVIYELWDGSKWLYKSERVEDAKAQAIQHNKEQLASIDSKAK
jgi:hypothetical protein